MAGCDAVSTCVPTPLSKTQDPDLSYVVAAADAVAGADCVVIATNHTGYDWTWLQTQARLIVDTRHGLPQASRAVLALAPALD